MQSLGVISVNIWSILISLLNLLILFLLVKKFLFGPVNKMLAKRQSELDERYNAADKANKEAEDNKQYWNDKVSSVKTEADEMIKNARESAKLQGEAIVSKAKDQADMIVRQAENEAQLEMKKAEEGIKKEIVEVSTLLAKRILEREINEDDHHDLIDSFIEKIGDEK